MYNLERRLWYWHLLTRYINQKIWLILWPGDVINDVMNIYLYNWSHNLMIYMHRKFSDDIFARFLVIMKNVVISYIKEYRGLTLRPPVTSSMMSSSWKYFFWHNLGRSFHIWGQIEAVFNISKFSKWSPFWARDKLLSEVILEGEYTRKIAMNISDILSFWSTLKYWRRYINLKIWPTFWPGDVIDDVMSAWNITCTTRHPQQCTCKILFVWHQSFIVKSSGQT